MHLIVGLGNPGREYKYTRHNVGFVAIDALAKKLDLKFRKREDYLWVKTTIKSKPVIIAKPRQFVNLSGEAVKKMTVDFRVENDKILVIHDDADLALGNIRIKINGSSGGHRGVESIIQELGTRDFSRIRIGIGRDSGDLKDYVLGEASFSEKKIIEEAIKTSSDAVFTIIDKGIDEAMLLFNRRVKTKKEVK